MVYMFIKIFKSLNSKTVVANILEFNLNDFSQSNAP